MYFVDNYLLFAILIMITGGIHMLCIFDLDGTLVDSLEDLAEATEYALAQCGYPGHPLDAYKYFVGNGVKKLIERALGASHINDYARARAYFDAYYTEHCLDHTKAYPDMYPQLEKLLAQGNTLAVFTNKPDALAKKVIQACYPLPFQFVQGQTDQYPVKPDPAFLEAYFTSHGRESAVFIGDSNVDIETGKCAGLKTIGVTWGNRLESELREAGADAICHQPQEIVWTIGAWR